MNNHLSMADVTLQEKQFLCRRIVERLIVYSCFMAYSNLDTFMISLRAHWRQLLFPVVGRGGELNGFILTPGFIESVSSVTAFIESWRLAGLR